MEPVIKDLVGNLGSPNVLNSRFIQLINSLSGLRTLANLGGQYLDKGLLIESIMDAVIENIGTEEVALYLLDGESLHCVANLNWEQFSKKEFALNSNSLSYAMNEGVVGKAAESRKVVHLQNTHDCKNNTIDDIHKKNAGSIICAPIMANKSLIGVLELSHPSPNHFESWQEHSIVIYTDLIGLLFNNFKLMTDMQNIVDIRTQELRNALDESEKLRARYEEMSVIDPLTKLYNRRYFFTEVTSSLARAKRYSHPFTLLLMDLDNFKEVNDTFGHECGDEVLIAVSNILNQFTREGDTLARIGGEEFVLALPETDYDGALHLAERIRKTVEDYDWECKEEIIKVSISIGVSSINDCEKNEIQDDDIQVSDILRKSDLALYYMKQHGRNGVKAFTAIP